MPSVSYYVNSRWFCYLAPLTNAGNGFTSIQILYERVTLSFYFALQCKKSAVQHSHDVDYQFSMQAEMASLPFPAFTPCLAIWLMLFPQVALSQNVVFITDAWADIDKRTVMTCAIGQHIGLDQLQLLKNDLSSSDTAGAILIYEYDALLGVANPGVTVNASRYEFLAAGNFPLTIKSVELTDEGKYWCAVTAINTDRFRESSILNVRVPPTAVSISYNGTTYTDGDSFAVVAGRGHQFTCNTLGVKPSGFLTWALSAGVTTDQLFGTQMHAPNSGDSRLVDSANTITVAIPESPATSQLTCGATNRQDGMTDSEVEATVTVQVRVPPKAVTLSDSDGEKSQGATVAVDEGSSHTFTCIVQGTRPAATLQWLIDDAMPTGVGTPTSTESNELFDTTGIWSFIPTRDNHRQEVKCVASTAELQQSFPSAAITLDVIGPPQPIVINQTLLFTENVTTRLTCSADMGYPSDWSLVWSNGGTPISGPTTTSPTSGNRYIFTSTVDFTPMREDNGNSIQCEVRRATWTPTPMETLGPINVQFCARTVSISCPFKAASGSTASLSCESSTSNPAATLIWSKDGVDQPNPAQPVFADGDYGGQETTFGLTTGVLTKTDNGVVYKCCVNRTLCTVDVCDSCTLIVEYRPEFSPPTSTPSGPVAEGVDVILSCTADANPKPPDLITWKKVGSTDSLTSIYSDGTSTLTLNNITREQAGSYRCRGNNGVPPVVYSSSIDVAVHYGVVILNTGDTSVGANENYDAALVCRARGNPLPRMTWSGPSGSDINNQTEPGKIFQVDTITDGDDVYGFIITSILQINRVTAMDFRSYTCNSGNGIGKVDTLTIELNNRFKPLPPQDVSVDQGEVTSDSVTVAWNPGDDGGEPQWFLVNYREVETTTGFDHSTRIRVPGGVSEHTFVGLRPYTVYEIEVYTENANGVSEIIKATVRTIPDTPGNLGIDVTINQDTGSISVDGIPQDGDSSSCLQLQARLTNQDQWFDYGDCLETNTEVVIQDARSRYCYGNVCSEATTALTVTGQSNNSGPIAGIVILAVIATISIALNVVAIVDIKRKKSRAKHKGEKIVSKSRIKSEEKRGVVNEIVVYQDLDVPLQILSSDSGNLGASTYASISETLAAFSRDRLTIVRELGQGAFGKVLLGEAKGIVQTGVVTQVAIKTIKDGAGLAERGDLLRELDFMKLLPSHANVVKLLGYCVEEDPVYIILEYLSKGALKDLLTNSRGKGKQVYGNLHGRSKFLTSRDLIKFARDVADGMAFLASQQCIHRDLAARNVLVGENMVCKVSDFGLARDVKNLRVYQRQSEV